MGGVLWRKVQDYPWGSTGLLLLGLSVISGVVVALQFDVAAPFYSTVAMELTVPFGGFWRSLHFYSSQLFFLFVVIHFAIIALQPGLRLDFRRWLYLVGSLVVILLLLFTGYVLRADATGEAAGHIAENIFLTVPLVGGLLNDIFFSVSTDGLRRVFCNHLVTLPFIWLLLSWDHVRRYTFQWGRHPGLVFVVLLGCSAITAPMEPFAPGLRHINGPWFFLGVQELLRVVQPFWAGVVYPLLLPAALLLLHDRQRRPAAAVLIFVWLASWSVLTVMALGR